MPTFLRGYQYYLITMQNPSEAPQQKQAQNQKMASSSSPRSRSSSGSSSSESKSYKSDSGSASKNGGQGEEGPDGKVIRYKYCCKVCKHPDKSKRACVCVVPLSQRRASLGEGCRNCGCSGCSKEDYISKGQDPEYHPQFAKEKNAEKRKIENQKRQQKRGDNRRDRSHDKKRGRSPRGRSGKYNRNSQSRSRSPQYIDSVNMKFYNFDRSMIGNMIVTDYGLNPILMGFGVPQRSYSYVFGKPQ